MKRKKMRMLIALVLGAAAVTMCLPSYAETAASMVVKSISKQVPVEFELQRAEGMLSKIEPQIERCKHDVAQAEVNLENLEADIRKLRDRVAEQESTLKRGAELLRGAPNGVLAASATEMAKSRMAVDLKRRLEVCKNHKAMLSAKEKLRDRHRQAVGAARARLDAVRCERDHLHDMAQSLRVQKMQIEALAAATPNLKLDDSALSEAKSVLGKIKNRLDVAQKMLDDESVFAAGDKDTPVSPELVEAEIRDFVSGKPAAPAAPARR